LCKRKKNSFALLVTLKGRTAFSRIGLSALRAVIPPTRFVSPGIRNLGSYSQLAVSGLPTTNGEEQALAKDDVARLNIGM